MKECKNKKIYKPNIYEILFLFKFLAIFFSFICFIYFIKYKYNFNNYYIRSFKTKEINYTLMNSLFILYMFLYFISFLSYIYSIFKMFKKETSTKINDIIFFATNLIISLSYLGLFFSIPLKRNKPLSELLILIFFIELATTFIIFEISFKRKNKIKKNNILDLRTVVEVSIMAALSVLLSILADLIIPKFPAIMGGGRPSLTMLPIILISLRKGIIPGVITGFIYSIFNILIDGYIIHIGSIFLDYIIPFTLLGLAGAFKNQVKKGYSIFIYFSTIMVATIRYISSSFSGVLFFSKYAPKGINPYVYSFIYVNAAPIFIGAYLTVAILYSLNKHFILEKSKII